MDEEEFDALMTSRPFGTGDVADWEAKLDFVANAKVAGPDEVLRNARSAALRRFFALHKLKICGDGC